MIALLAPLVIAAAMLTVCLVLMGIYAGVGILAGLFGLTVRAPYAVAGAVLLGLAVFHSSTLVAYAVPNRWVALGAEWEECRDHWVLHAQFTEHAEAERRYADKACGAGGDIVDAARWGDKADAKAFVVARRVHDLEVAKARREARRR